MKALLVALSIALCFTTAHAVSPRLDAKPYNAPLVHHPGPQHREDGSKKAHFRVDGRDLPLVNATVQDSYAGRLPIASNDTRSLFFWYWPSSARSSKTLTIWLNGGPGCSSLTGFLTELGTFTFRPGTDAPSVNEFAWSTVSDMLYIDQPVSVGFSSGESDVEDEIGVANQFYGFLQQFYKVFPELLHKKLYIAGESYAGMYIPYIADRIVKASPKEKAAMPINLQSILINNGIYAHEIVRQVVPMADFVVTRQGVLGIDDDAVQEVVAAAHSPECRLQDITAQVVYPPKGPIYADETNVPFANCYAGVVLGAWNAATDVNSCFNFYRITDVCPLPRDPIESYFSRADVQEALNVPGFGPWKQCVRNPFRDHEDKSPYSSTILPGLIEALPRGVTLWHGLDDIFVLANGTRLTIQNMTWGGLQGFQTPITQQIIFDGKPNGVQHSERGLTYYEIENAGHMVPTDQPKLALEVLKTVIGKGTGKFIRS